MHKLMMTIGLCMGSMILSFPVLAQDKVANCDLVTVEDIKGAYNGCGDRVTLTKTPGSGIFPQTCGRIWGVSHMLTNLTQSELQCHGSFELTTTKSVPASIKTSCASSALAGYSNLGIGDGDSCIASRSVGVPRVIFTKNGTAVTINIPCLSHQSQCDDESSVKLAKAIAAKL